MACYSYPFLGVSVDGLHFCGDFLSDLLQVGLPGVILGRQVLQRCVFSRIGSDRQGPCCCTYCRGAARRSTVRPRFRTGNSSSSAPMFLRTVLASLPFTYFKVLVK
jgi:hypothetical protein